MTTTKEPTLGREHALHLLHQMLRIRRLEEKCAELYQATKIRGFLHLYIGEEAVAVGVMQSLTPEDSVVATYREHGHALVRGMSPEAIMAEMYGKQEGCSRGRGGSMHLYDKATRFFGGNAIVGGGLPLSLGIALADKMQGRKNVTACFFGEGAVAEGEFHETMNLSALWHAPVLFCCENNFYAMGTAIERSESETNLMVKVASYGMPHMSVDGMDVIAVEAAAKKAIDYVRNTGSPYFLEFRTYRFRAHSMFDAELYRDKQEVARWREKDPILDFSAYLKDQHMLSDEDLQRLEKDVAAEVQRAVDFAEAGTWENTADLTRFVHSEGV